jgi:hypothetical protein
MPRAGTLGVSAEYRKLSDGIVITNIFLMKVILLLAISVNLIEHNRLGK